MNFFESFSQQPYNGELIAHLSRARGVYEAIPALSEERIICQQLLSGTPSSYMRLEPIVLDSGVALYDIPTFVEQYPVLALKYIINPEHEGWRTRILDAFIEGYWQTSVVIFVPPTVNTDTVIDVRVLLEPYTTDRVIEKCIIIVQAHAYVTILDRGISSNHVRTIVRSVDCLVGEYATVIFHVVQPSMHVEYEYVHYSLYASNKSILQMVASMCASKKSKIFVDCFPHGKHATISLRGLVTVGRDRALVCTTTQQHHAVLGGSEVLIKAGVGNAGLFDYQGLVKIEKDAAKSSAHQRNMVLLLSDKARARSLPILEVIHNDVSCSHGSAVGQVDPTQIVYLQTRGLSEIEARALLVRGFIDDILRSLTSINHGAIADDITQILNEGI